MRWPWTKRAPPPPTIPPYQVPVSKRETAKESGIVVEEVDTSAVSEEDLAALRLAQSQTGMHRVWNKLTGRD